MNEYLNSIIIDINSTEKQVSLAKKWLEFESINVIPVCDKEGVQILSSNWEEEVLENHFLI